MTEHLRVFDRVGFVLGWRAVHETAIETSVAETIAACMIRDALVTVRLATYQRHNSETRGRDESSKSQENGTQHNSYSSTYASCSSAGPASRRMQRRQWLGIPFRLGCDVAGTHTWPDAPGSIARGVDSSVSGGDAGLASRPTKCSAIRLHRSRAMTSRWTRSGSMCGTDGRDHRRPRGRGFRRGPCPRSLQHAGQPERSLPGADQPKCCSRTS